MSDAAERLHPRQIGVPTASAAASRVEVRTLRDGYRLHVRRWGASSGTRLVLLHGIVSHSGWLHSVARPLADSGIDVVAPDRRGAGRNTVGRGDVPSARVLLDDLSELMGWYGEDGAHLGGFCWGASWATNYQVAREDQRVRSLTLLAPSIFPAGVTLARPLATGDSEVPTEEPVIPPEAFTQGEAYRSIVMPDPLRLRLVSRRFNAVVAEMGALLGVKLGRVRIPTMIILAADDTVTDNDKTERAFAHMCASRKRLLTVPGAHGVQFDAPGEVVAALRAWIDDIEGG